MISKSTAPRTEQKKHRVFVQFLLICVTIFAFQPSANASDHIVRAAQKLPVLFNTKDTKFYSIEELSGGVHTTFKPARFFHGQGDWHSDIFRVQRNGKSYLIKTTLPGTDGFGDDDYFVRHLFGYLLAENIGGPAITRAGRFKNAEGIEGYFVEMEELFVNDKNSFTYKGIRSAHNKFIQRLGLRILTKAHIKNIAKLIIKTLENGLFIDDLDFIFSTKSDHVRWIDTTHWYITYVDHHDDRYWLDHQDPKALVNPALLSHVRGYQHLEHIRTLFNDFRLMNKAYAKELWISTIAEIEASQVWSAQEKQNMKNNFKNALSFLMWFQKEMGCDEYLNASPNAHNTPQKPASTPRDP